jgi:hypothetical protein
MRTQRWMLLVLLAVSLTACSAPPKRVDCEKHLRPINLPAPLAKTARESR